MSRHRNIHHRIAPVAAPLVLAAAVGGCASRANHPDAAIRGYADAILAANWDAARGWLADDSFDDMTPEDWRQWCTEHEGLLRAQAEALLEALDEREPAVAADVPLDAARRARLSWDEDRWYLDEQLPLLDGGDTPEETMVALAGVLRSPPMQDVLALLSDDMRQRYAAEVDAIADALARGADGVVQVFGERASIELGDITVRFVRERGIWQVDAIEQPWSYDYYGYDW